MTNVINQILKSGVTLGIWMCLTIILTSSVNAHNSVWLAVILGIGATVSTWRIWSSGGVESAQEAAFKNKRTNRISRMVNNLDDEEIAELSDLLIAREESQLADQRQRLRR